MTAYKVTLINEEENSSVTIDVPEDEFIVNIAEEAGLNIPFSCRAGACSTCTGILVSGNIDQSEQRFLSERQIGCGFVLTCKASPTSNCTIKVGKEQSLYEV